jgi:uncharacterized protein YjiS (DUF1127 family)
MDANPEKPLTLVHTKAALAEYDRTAPERDAMLAAAMDDKGVTRWEVAEHAARRKVKEAFYKDTSDRNSLDHCMVVGLFWLRDQVARHAGDK